MEILIEDHDELVSLLRDKGLKSKPVIIGIDGATGVGKSRLAYCIACKVGIPVINLDHYAENITGSYKEATALKDIDRLTTRYRNSQRTYVIEGVCLLEVLDAINIKPDILLYYKKYNKRREWIDEEICSCSLNEQTMQSLPILQRAIARYNNKYRPMDSATFIVYRIEAD